MGSISLWTVLLVISIIVAPLVGERVGPVNLTPKVKGHEDIYALGAATDIPVSSSGSAGHFQAKVVSENLAEELSGDGAPAKYDEHVMCFLETGYGRGLTLDFNYNRPSKASHPNRIAHWEKTLLNKLYWSTKARV